MKKTIITIVILLLIAACTKPTPNIVAEVDGTDITARDLVEEMSMERSNFDPALIKNGKGYKLFRKQALEKLIQKNLLLNLARKIGISATLPESTKKKEFAKRIAEQHGVNIAVWNRTQRERLIIESLIQNEVTEKIPVSKSEIKKYYHNHLKEFRRPLQHKARQIVVNDRKTADEISVKLKAGEDFAELARKHSMSPDAKSGGELEFFDASSYPKIFELTCKKLKVGEMSDVTSTEYGYQIFQLQGRRPAHTKSLEEVAPIIRKRIQEERSGKMLKDWFNSLQSKATIRIDESKLEEVKLAPKQ